MTEDELCQLLIQPERPALDFKLTYWDSNAAMVHDILCMSNSIANGPRYLVLGVEDKTRRIDGVNADPNRKNSQQITDTLRGAGINHVPNIEVKTVMIDGKDVDLVIIHHSANAPYFLAKDKQERGKCVRAGVVYTRDNDCNTEIDKSASEQVIEWLWLNRLTTKIRASLGPIGGNGPSHDQILLAEFLSTFPAETFLNFFRQQNFGDAFSFSRMQELAVLAYDWAEVTREFHSNDIEQLKLTLVSTAKDFYNEAMVRTSGVSGGNLLSVYSDSARAHYDRRPDFVIEDAEILNAKSKLIVSSYEEFVRAAKRKLTP